MGHFMLLNDVVLDGLSLKMVRDDLFPYVGGGSKARKAVEYETFLNNGGYNAIVTCGGIQSNHNRAFAILAAKNGWKCHLCIQGSKDRFFSERGNALLCRLAGAECEFILPAETSFAMDRAMAKLSKEGYRPYYVHGGGHDLPGGTCFVDAVAELKKHCESIGYKPDYIFHASGTGSTQAGIIVGLELAGWGDVKVMGISVARQKERGRQAIIDFAHELGRHYGLNQDFTEKVYFNADYLYGGYEAYTDEMSEYLMRVMASTGIMFDTTYSGKGFYGMMKEVEKLKLREKSIIFWHTGGLMNLQK